MVTTPNSPDSELESLVRDPDLKARIEEARGDFGFRWIVIGAVKAQQERDAQREAGAKIISLAREQRRRAQVQEQLKAAPEPADIRHIHSVLAICGLPYHKQGATERRFERRQGNMSLVVTAGELMTPGGKWQEQPLPYGPKARLILMHLCSEAVRQKTATIEIADTFTAFVRELGFPDNAGRGGALTAFKQQLNALAACSINMSTWNGTTAKTKRFQPIDEFQVWLSDNPAQRSLWPSTVTFSSTMFESLKKHALPVNVRAVRAFAGSARKLDLYFWIGYRLHNIDEPLPLSWGALHEQFGEGFSRTRDFQRKLALEIGQLKEVFPKLPVKLTEQGLILSPADPEVLSLPKRQLLKKS